MRRTRDLLVVWCAASTTFLLGMLVASCEPTRDLTAVEAPQEQPSAAALVSSDSANVLGVGSDKLLYVPPGAGERGPKGEKGDVGPEGPMGPAGSGGGLRILEGGGEMGQSQTVEAVFEGIDYNDVFMFQCQWEDESPRMIMPCTADTGVDYAGPLTIRAYKDPSWDPNNGGLAGQVRILVLVKDGS